MKKNNTDNIKLLYLLLFITGIVFILCGSAHNLTAPVMYKQISKEPVFQGKAPGFIFFFVSMGTSIIFTGILLVYACKGIKKLQKWAWNIALGSSFYILITHLFAVIYAGFDNPLIYIIIIFSVLSTIFLLIYYKTFKKIQDENYQIH